MEFDSIEFILYCAVSVAIISLVRASRARLFVTLGLSSVFFASFASSLSDVVPIIGFIGFGYVAIILSPQLKTLGFCVLLSTVIAVFVWLKKYAVVSFFAPGLPFPYMLVGLSFIFFRVIHLMVDVRQGALKSPGFLTYFSYVAFFLTFVSGPIQRYEDFARQVAEPQFPVDAREIHAAFNRILLGFFLVAVITKITFYFFGHIESYFYYMLDAHQFGLRTCVFYALTATAYTTHLYLNFVGYMEVVIGVGLLCGFRLPENFNRPYLSVNYIDLWSRWHMTLSNWIKFYIFNPLLTALNRRWDSPTATPYFGVVAYFVSFLTIGLWHGTSLIYLLYGFCFGFVIAANKLYQIMMVKRFGRDFYRALSSRNWYRHFCRGLTLASFFGIISCVWLSPEHFSQLASPMGLEIVAVGLFAITLSVFVLSFGLAGMTEIHSRVTRAIWPAGAGPFQSSAVGPNLRDAANARPISPFTPIWVGAKFFVVFNLALILGGSAPEFVYKVF